VIETHTKTGRGKAADRALCGRDDATGPAVARTGHARVQELAQFDRDVALLAAGCFYFILFFVDLFG